LREKYNRPLPAAHLLTSDSYDELMEDVVDVRDLGSGVIGGTECDYLAFRKKDVDWQIWFAQGSRTYPCRYDIATKVVAGSPGYSIQIRDWKTGSEVASGGFSFTPPPDARRVDAADLAKLKDMSDLPSNQPEKDAAPRRDRTNPSDGRRRVRRLRFRNDASYGEVQSLSLLRLCEGCAIPMDSLDTLVGEHLADHVFQPDRLTVLLESYLNQSQDAAGNADSVLAGSRHS
jgi:hypothetical protein